MIKHHLPSYSSKKEDVNEDPSKKIINFLKENSQWTAKGAMVGTLTNNEIYINKTKGPQKFILFRQSQDNSFVFHLIEAASLLYSKKIIILTTSIDNNLFAPSAHFITSFMIQNGHTFRDLKLYSIFSRMSASSRKPNEPTKRNEIVECKKIGYSEMILNSKNQGPKESVFQFTDIFPITQTIKIPVEHKAPDNFALTIKNVQAKTSITNDYTCVPVNLRCLISIRNVPKANQMIRHYG